MNWQRWIGQLDRWGNFGLGPIPTRQYSAALFTLSGHIVFGLLLTFALIPPKPERVQAPASKTIRVQLNPAAKPTPPESAANAVVPPPPAAPPVPVSASSVNALNTTTVPIPEAASANPPITPPTAAPSTAPTTPTAAITNSTTGTTGAATTENPAQVEVAYYYPPRQLQQKPRVIEDIESNMSLTLPGVETQNVILRLFINELGTIDHIDIEQSSLDADVVAAVSGAFGKLRFTPGKIDGVAVKSQLKIEVLLENAEASKTGKGN